MAQELTKEELESLSPEEIKELQKQQCIFCQIVAGKVPVKKIYEDEMVIAILDINPAVPGHTLLLPKGHYQIMPLLPDALLKHLGKVTKHISEAFSKRLFSNATSVFIANGSVAGQQVQHVLIHIIPREDGDGLETFDLGEGLSFPEMEQMKQVVSEQIYSAMGQKPGKITKNVSSHKKSDENGIDLDNVLELLGGK